MAVSFWAICCATLVSAAGPVIAQERFDSPDAAAKAIIDAAEHRDSARLLAILGQQAARILTSGDPAQDRAEQSEFARMARAKYRVEVSPLNPNRAVLAIGEEDWPFPVPLRRTSGRWSFDASQTPAEMLARRIGANELDAIEICHGYVAAQSRYASEVHDIRGMPEYSPRLMSRPGAHDGLYWEGAGNPLIPEGLARAEWRSSGSPAAKPYHGYYFRILDGQGDNAAGGAHNYLVKGRLIGGYALVAWPAAYGVTGIHTFIVNQQGVVYEKDNPPDVHKPPAPILRFDPDRTWEPVE